MDDVKDTSFAAAMKDSSSRQRWIQQNKLNIILYITGIAFVLFVYHVFSDGDFSFLLTLGSMVRMFGIALVLVKFGIQKNCSGISLKTLELYALVFAARLSSILVYEGYLPYDSSGDFIYQLVEVLALLLTLCAIASVLSMGDLYVPSEDGFGNWKHIPNQLGAFVLVVPALVLALLFHPKLNKNFFTDTAWTFAAYLETVAVLPQFYMLQKLNKPVEEWVSHFVFSLGLSRLFLFLFWFSSYNELSERKPTSILGGYEGYLVLFVNLAHILIMAEFCYYYILAAKKKSPLIIPNLQV